MKTKEFLKRNLNIILTVITIIISCCMYWNYLIGHYATETYGIANNYQDVANSVYLPDGRIFSFIFFTIAGKLNIPILITVSISVFIGIIIGAIAVIELKKQLEKLIDLKFIQEIVVWLICYNIIFNFIFVEIMYFTESCIMAFSILAYVLAAKFFTNKKYILAFICVLIGIFCYQGTVGFFIVCSASLSMIKNKKINKEFIYDIIKMAFVCIIAAMLNLIFIKVITSILGIRQNKQFSLNLAVIITNISMIIKGIGDILQNSCGLFPTSLMLIFIEILLFFTIYISIYEKQNRITNFLILAIITIASSCMLFLIQMGSFYTGRVHYCIGSLVGILLLYLYCLTQIRETKSNNIVFIIILFTYCIINCANTVQLVTEHQKVNKLEKEECIKIQEMITYHENTTNTKITKITPLIVGNNQQKGWFDQINRKAVVTYNNVRHYWGYAGVINYYLETKLKVIQPDYEKKQKYVDYIKTNNLEFGDIVCIEDTLYCMQYII